MNESTSEDFTSLKHEKYVKTVGRAHQAPAYYKYLLKVLVECQFVNLLKLEKFEYIGNIDSPSGSVYMLNGECKVNDTAIFVINQEKQGYYFLWFKSRSEAENLWNYVFDKVPKPSTVNSIYKFTKHGWQHLNNYAQRDSIDLIGYEHHLETIQKDIVNYHKYLTFLKSIGEGSRTLNYLLYGPPGTGKTTLIKTLGSTHNIPIFIVNPTLMENVDASSILNPKTAVNGKTKIVLFEDFDRYLSEGKYNMSEILNELDGIESSEGVVRFFTCNNMQEILKHDALINRVSAKFEFFMPTIEHFRAKLNRFLSLYPAEWQQQNEIKISEFMSVVESTCVGKLTLRPFSNYVIRYLFDENCMDLMISHLDELR